MKKIDIKLYITNKDTIYDVTQLCTDSITLATQRRGSPAKLTFKVARDIVTGQTTSFFEGNNVKLIIDGINMFSGYIFSKSRTKDQIITVTAYDQTRYLKNKDTYNITGKTATEVIQAIADDFKLKVGTLSDTEYRIDNRIEDNQTLWDIILNALDLTTINTDKVYIFYDDFGLLTLKSIDEMLVKDILISDMNTLINFNFQTDIDTDTYNQIKLYRDPKEEDTNRGRKVFKVLDSLNQLKWGVLQYSESISDAYSEEKIIDIANRLLELKNRVKKTLSVEDIGDLRVRAGCSLPVVLKDIGESIDKILVVENCTHTFKNNEHTMKLELVGDF